MQIFVIENQKQFLKIVFLDVGQGDAIFIETPNGFKVIIDAGVNSAVVRSVAKFIPFYNRNIDLLIATHSDADHIGGFVDLINRFKIYNFAQNFIEDSDALNTEIKKLLESQKINQYFLKSGDKIILDYTNNIYLEVLWPPFNNVEKDNNDNSIIVRLVYGDIEAILTGDASLGIEKKLIQNLDKEKLQSDILKAGHHGSRTSTSLEFLSSTYPEFVVISAGKDNSFNHPHQEVLDNIKTFAQQNEKEIKILETSVLGSIYFQSDGKSVWLVE